MSRRQAYRVPVPDRGEIKLSVELAGWPAIAGKICNATADGLAVTIAADVPLRVTVGERLRLTVWLVSENRAIVLDADVMTVNEDEENRKFGVRFLTPDRARRELADVLGGVFNRRAAPRVSPKEGTTVQVRPAPNSELVVDARVTNVSETGLGVSLAVFDDSLTANTACSVTLDIDGNGEVLNLSGRLCHQHDLDGVQRWGIALDVNQDDQVPTEYDSYRAYVIDRARLAQAPI